MSRLYLIDTVYHIFRAFHALPATLTAPDGRPTNAVHGVLGIFSNLWRSEQVEYAVAVFESATGTFREELDPEYKANREPPDPNLKRQIPLVEQACRCLGIPTLALDGYEADDVMGALAHRAVAAGHSVTIVSNDKDLAQILALGGDIELLRLSGTGKNAKVERIRPEGVVELFGVPPELIPSWLALKGDTVDNIKGVPGIGQKTASKLLLEHGGLANLLAEPTRAGRYAGQLVALKDRLVRDLEVATIKTDLDLGFDGLDLERYRPIPLQGAVEFFEDLGMHRHLSAVEQLIFPEPTVAELWG